MIDKDLALTQKKCDLAAEDLNAFYRSLASLAERLKPAWRFQISCEPGQSHQFLTADSLRNAFAYQVGVAAENFLARERREGKPWPDIRSFIESSSDPKEQDIRKNYVRLLAWGSLKGKFLEALCLMATLSRLIPLEAQKNVDAFGTVGPLKVRDQDRTCFLWSRPIIESQHSGLNAVPDIVITSTPDRVSTTNILSIIECKCRQTIHAADLRGEFGKAYDLGSPSYVLVSYYDVQEIIVAAGRELGIDVQVFSLSTSDREQFVRGERDIGEDMAVKLLNARTRRTFLAALENRAADVRRRAT
ncbi:MAG: hypothetical protein WD688_20765 [Candidatus Binatia bacterium]